MRFFLLIIATVVGVTYGYGYAIVLWIVCRIVISVIAKGAESSARYQTYNSHNYRSSYQNNYQHNNTSGNSQKTESKGIEYHYSVLGVSSNATDAEIKKAYRDMVRKFHPDMVSTQGENAQRIAERKTQELNEAYQNIKSWRKMN